MHLDQLVVRTLALLLLLATAGCQSPSPSLDGYLKGIHIVPKPNSSDVSLHLFVASGNQLSNDAPKEGLAHYTEHLVARGLMSGEASKYVHRSNASTTHASVEYWVQGSTSELPKLVNQLARVFDPILTTEKYAKEEVDIVQREYDYRLLSNEDGRAYQAMSEYLYKNNPRAVSVLGSPTAISELTLEDAKAWHTSTHKPENAVLVLVGNVSANKVLSALKDSSISMNSEDVDQITRPVFSLHTHEENIAIVSDTNAANRLMWRKLVPLDEAIEFELLDIHTVFLESLLQSNVPGGLAGPLRFDSFIARSFSVQVFPIDEKHIEISFFAEADSGVTLKELKLAFEDTLSQSLQSIPEASINRILKRLKQNYWQSWEDEDEFSLWMTEYVLTRVSQVREPLTRNEIRELENQISTELLRGLAEALLNSGRTSIALIGENKP